MPRDWCIVHGSAQDSPIFSEVRLYGGRAYLVDPRTCKAGDPLLLPVSECKCPAALTDNMICEHCAGLNAEVARVALGGSQRRPQDSRGAHNTSVPGGSRAPAGSGMTISQLDDAETDSDSELDSPTNVTGAAFTGNTPSVLRKKGYVIGDKLGQGSYGVVHMCTREGTDEKYAIKVIPKSSITTDKAKEQLEREINTMASLDHPNIVSFIAREEDRNWIFVVMEYASRGDTFDLLEKYPTGVPEKLAAKLMYQAVSAVHYIHQKGILHRDIKPENFFLSRNGDLKCGDFGFANFMLRGGRKRILQTPCGSAQYVSPEIINKEAQGPYVDVWSLGISLYTLVSAQDPWQRRGKLLTVVEQYHQILKGEYNKLPSKISAECADLIKRMVTVSIKDRITLPEVLRHAWFKKQGIVK